MNSFDYVRYPQLLYYVSVFSVSNYELFWILNCWNQINDYLNEYLLYVELMVDSLVELVYWLLWWVKVYDSYVEVNLLHGAWLCCATMCLTRTVNEINFNKVPPPPQSHWQIHCQKLSEFLSEFVGCSHGGTPPPPKKPLTRQSEFVGIFRQLSWGETFNKIIYQIFCIYLGWINTNHKSALFNLTTYY